MNHVLKKITGALSIFCLLNPAQVVMAAEANRDLQRYAMKVNANDSASFEDAVGAYNLARPAFEKKGLQAFIAALPVKFSDEDQRYAYSHVSGIGALPEVTLQKDGSVLVSVSRGSTTKTILVQFANAKRHEFEVNGIVIKGGRYLQDNAIAISQALGVESAGNSNERLNWVDVVIPRAEAAGMDSSTLLISALVIVGAGLITYFVAKNNSGHSSSSSTAKTSGPAVGNTVSESLH